MVHKSSLGFAAVDAGLTANLEVEGQAIDLRSVPPTLLPDSVIKLTRHVNPDGESPIASYCLLHIHPTGRKFLRYLIERPGLEESYSRSSIK